MLNAREHRDNSESSGLLSDDLPVESVPAVP